MVNGHSQFLYKKTEYNIEMNTLHWYGLQFIDTNLRPTWLYVYFCSCLKYYAYTGHLKM